MQAGIGALVVDRKSGDMKLEGTKPEDKDTERMADSEELGRQQAAQVD